MTGRLVLGDYIELQRGNTYKSALLEQPGPVLLGLASIARNGGFRRDSLRTYGGESDERMLLRPGDIFASLKDVTQSADLLGAVARVPRDVPLGRLTQDTVKLKFLRESEEERRYIYWVLRGPECREYCRARAIGTTNLSLAREDFLGFPIRSLSIEDLVGVELLDALDERIELNRRTNDTLEAMVRALFKSWFVDFDPARAKAERRSPAGMDAATAALFPDRFVGSELGSVPHGWRVGRLGDVLELKRGYDLPHSQRHPGNVPVVSSSGPTGFHSKAKAKAPGIVTGRYGTIGRVVLVRRDFWPLNTTLYVRDAKGNEPLFLYGLLELLNFAKFSDKAAVPGINRNHVHEERVVVPGPALQLRYSEVVAPLLDLSAARTEETAALVALRDTLLPRLLSGELRVRDAEKVAERAV